MEEKNAKEPAAVVTAEIERETKALEPVVGAEILQPILGRYGKLVGVLATAVFLALTYWYLDVKAHVAPPAPSEQVSPAALGSVYALLLNEKVADIGQFISGIAAAIAFFWIVLAYFQQSEDLRLQRGELKLQRTELALQRAEFHALVKEAAEQVKVLKETARGAKRDAFIRALELYERQLSLECARLFTMICELRGTHPNALHTAWQGYEAGDHYIFYKRLIDLFARGEHVRFFRDVDKIMSGREYVRKICNMASEILAHAGDVDAGMLAFCERADWATLAAGYRDALANIPVSKGTNPIRVEDT